MNSLPIWIRIASGTCLVASLLSAQNAAPSCRRTIYANVVALDQPIMVNRLGSAIPGGMIYALARDVVKEDTTSGLPTTTSCDSAGSQCLPGQVILRSGKRPRPIVLRVSVGDCLVVNLTNLVAQDLAFDQLTQAPGSATPQPGAPGQLWGQSSTRAVGFHAAGLDLMLPPDTGLPATPPPPACTPLRSDGDFVGRNCSSQAEPGQTRTYKFYAREEGHYLAYSKDDALAAAGNAGQIQSGLFGSVTVEPANAEYYRSQVLQTDLQDATYVACGATRTTECVGAGPGQSTGNAVRLVEKPGTKGKEFTLTMSQNPGAMPATAWTVTVVKDAQQRLYTLDGHPVVNYSATYQSGNAAGQPAGTPVLRMLQPRDQEEREFELVHSDLTAIVTGPGASRFPDSQQSPLFSQNPALPDRREPFREFTVHYHASAAVVQAFPSVPGTVTDSFAINYGIGGIGNEILANRLKVGAPGDCVECKFEEFFLSSWVLGDPAMLVDHPTGGISPGAAKAAMNGSHSPESASEQEKNPEVVEPVDQAKLVALDQIQPAVAQVQTLKATKVFYPDDPSNVYHSYMRDHVKFRISNVSPIQTHVHHQHAHQWLQTPNSDDSAYLDSQLVVPGSTYTLEMTYNGSGNRNQTVGDSIFHCHFYPHFAGGMWALWRVHDVFEAGTTLNRDGSVAVASAPGSSNRALPDAEIESGTPIPAIVPLPSLGMAPLPAQISLADHGKRVVVKPEPGGTFRNPGFPFFIPGFAGHRPPHPPMDFAWEENADGTPKLENGQKVSLDGGLPRHLILGGKVVNEFHTRWDFTKDLDGALAYRLPEDGTAVEKVAMAEHARRTRPTSEPDGQPGNFILNGLPPTSGGPFARPDIDDNGNAVPNTRRYKAAVFQTDVVLNKEGWHYPQQRWLSLWNDVPSSLNGARAPQPLFFRANSGENIEFWHTNLVPSYYEMDDYEVRTPTDIIGQHIHLVKFDVLASDGAANGFNYEDGTFAYDEVADRITQIKKGFGGPGGLYYTSAQAVDSCLDSAAPLIPCLRRLTPDTKLSPKPATAIFPANPTLAEHYAGAQTTIQLWGSDPLRNNKGKDRTLRTVFTHDHFGPSTHQNIGLYAGLLIEPPGSRWLDPNNGNPLGGGSDGGPTNWQAMIVTPNQAESYREFALEFQDLQEAYKPESKPNKSTPTSIPLFTVNVTKLPPFLLALQQGKMPQGLVEAFKANGITLSKTPKVIPKASCPTNPTYTWCIQDPLYPKQTFGIEAVANAPTPGEGSYNVFTPTMSPGWADPLNALSTNSTATNINPNVINSSPATGIYSLNYRNEPLPLRVNANGGSTGTQTDLAWAFASLPNRNDPKLNKQPTPGDPISPQSPFRYPPGLNQSPQLRDADPYTPLLSAYENDRVQIRTLVGAHTMTHSFRIDGLNWLYEPDYTDSGYKSAQGMGLSEHFEMEFTVPAPVKAPTATFSDYLYVPSSSMAGLAQGLWGMLRAYDGTKGTLSDLKTLPNNPDGHAAKPNITTGCPPNTNATRAYTVVAVSPQQLGLPGLVYNKRDPQDSTATQAAVFVNADDLENNKLKPGITGLEPLILRANAGDCIQVTLRNSLTTAPGFRKLPAPFLPPAPSGPAGPNVPVTVSTSQEVGIQADLLSSNVALGTGINVGFNNIGPGTLNGTAAPGKEKLLTWYAGKVSPDGLGIPVEFGAVPLVPADPLNQAADGMIGTLVVEPAGSIWAVDPGTRASATIMPAGGKPFREFVVMLQNALVPFGGTLCQSNGAACVQSGVNYRSEPLATRNTNFLIFDTQANIAAYVTTLKTCASLGKACPQLATSSFAAALKTPEKFSGNKNAPMGGYTLLPSATVTNASIPGAAAWVIDNGGTSITIQQTSGNGQLLMVRLPFNSALSDYSNFLSNARVGGVDPQTPIFCAAAGQPVRFRVTQPGGDFDHMMVVDGHSWKQEPYTHNSTVQGNNVLSQQMGTQVISANEKLDLLIDSAGGPFKVPGDYLYHSFQFEPYGMWGLFRVVPANTPADQVMACAAK
jgi:hypothetical protein